MTTTATHLARAARFRDQFAAERIKLLSLRSTYALTAIALMAAISSALFLSTRLRLSPYGRTSFDPLQETFNTGTWGTLMVGAACAGAVSMTGEYSSGLIRTTTVAVPSRIRTLLAKAAALAAVAAAVGAAAEAASYFISHFELASQGINTSSDGGTLVRDLIAAFVALPVSAVLGLAIGTLLRHPAVAALGTVVALVIVPGLVRTTGRGIQATFSNAMPYHAWSALVGQATDDNVQLQQPPTIPESWIWLAAWPCIALLAAYLVLRRKDL